MKRTVIIFGMLSLAVLVLFRYGSYSLRLGTLDLDVLLGGIAGLFFLLGFLADKKTNHHPEGKTETLNARRSNPEYLGLTAREQEVLIQICNGLSNREIAEKLCLSEHTIKTHVSNLLLKLNVKRRTQAMKRARELGFL